MVKNEAKKLEALAKVVHIYCEDDRHYGRSEWHDIVVEAGLGIDQRTAVSYFRLAKVRRLIHEHTAWRWCKGNEFSRFLPKHDDNGLEGSPDKQEDE